MICTKKHSCLIDVAHARNQGVCVSCLFCFANHDVQSELRNVFSRLFPNLMKPHLETNSKHDAPQATQTRDLIV